MKTRYMKYALAFFIALAIGTLLSTAILQLLPEVWHPSTSMHMHTHTNTHPFFPFYWNCSPPAASIFSCFVATSLSCTLCVLLSPPSRPPPPPPLLTGFFWALISTIEKSFWVFPLPFLHHLVVKLVCALLVLFSSSVHLPPLPGSVTFFFSVSFPQKRGCGLLQLTQHVQNWNWHRHFCFRCVFPLVIISALPSVLRSRPANVFFLVFCCCLLLVHHEQLWSRTVLQHWPCFVARLRQLWQNVVQLSSGVLQIKM